MWLMELLWGVLLLEMAESLKQKRTIKLEAVGCRAVHFLQKNSYKDSVGHCASQL